MKIHKEFIGGNITVVRIDGKDVYLENELRDTTVDWFYWAFCIEGAQGMELIGIPSQIYLILQTVIIFFMAAESGIMSSVESMLQRRRARLAARQRQKEAAV